MGSQCTEEVQVGDRTYRVDFDLEVDDKPAEPGTKCPEGHLHEDIIRRAMRAENVEIVCQDTYEPVPLDSPLGRRVVAEAVAKTNDNADTDYTCEACDVDYCSTEMTLP